MKYKFLNIALVLPKHVGILLGFLSKKLATQQKEKIINLIHTVVCSTGKYSYIFLYPFFYEYIKSLLSNQSLFFLYKSVDGPLMCLDLSKKTQRQIFLGRPYEEHVTAYIKKTLKSGFVFLDVGANVGYYSLLASKLVGSQGKVFAFEPETKNQIAFMKNIKINNFDNIIFKKAALGSSNQLSVLNLNPLNEGGHSLKKQNFYHDGVEVWTKEKILKTFADESLEQFTEVLTMDKFVFENRHIFNRVDLVKIDVEGFEAEVIQGALDCLSKGLILRMVCEVSEENLELPKKLQAFGFNAYSISPNGDRVPLKTIIEPNNYLFERDL